MRPLLQGALVNDEFGDPALYLEFLFERRALLMDLGDLSALPPRKILRLSHIFVSHAHMDHFAGLDRLVRICLARPMRVRLFGPADFLDRVEHRLAGYTWNLVHNYADDFVLEVTELHGDGNGRSAEFHGRHAFQREHETTFRLQDDRIVDEPQLRVRVAILDHRIPSLAFALEEERHANVLKNRLVERGLAVGPWLKTLKEAVLHNAGDDAAIEVLQESGDRRFLPLGALRDIVRIERGRKIAYVTDCAGHEANASRILALAQNADVLYIETPFLEEDRKEADRKYHLTARRAGELARLAHVRRVIPFHFSTRYEHCPERLRAELAAAHVAPEG